MNIKLFVFLMFVESYSISIKICVVFVAELNLRAIPVKYGRELTRMHPLQIGKNIST